MLRALTFGRRVRRLCTTPLTTTRSGLMYRDVHVTEAAEATRGDTVSVHYTGRLEDGKIFDSSDSRGPIQFTLGNREVIKGWDEGVMAMSLGEKSILNITSDFGYGERGAGGVIPPNADLKARQPISSHP